MTWEYVIIGWLYAFGGAATVAALPALYGRHQAGAEDFFVAVLWPVLVPLVITVRAIVGAFR